MIVLSKHVTPLGDFELENDVINKLFDFEIIFEDGGSGVPNDWFGQVKLSKEVVNPYHTDHEFEFRITFDQDVEARYKIGDSESLPFINGSVISVRNLQEILISGIPFGTRYVIEEIQKENYIMLSERYEGIVMDDIVTLKAFNNYDGPETREGYLEILKHVVGKTTDKAFDFELHVNDEIKPFSLKDGEMVSYTFEKGTHYSVYEKDYRNDGYILTLVDGQGTIEKGVVSEVIATNTYDPSLEQRLYALRKETKHKKRLFLS